MEGSFFTLCTHPLISSSSCPPSPPCFEQTRHPLTLSATIGACSAEADEAKKETKTETETEKMTGNSHDMGLRIEATTFLSDATANAAWPAVQLAAPAKSLSWQLARQRQGQGQVRFTQHPRAAGGESDSVSSGWLLPKKKLRQRQVKALRPSHSNHASGKHAHSSRQLGH